MKKTIVALAIASVGATAGASAASLYNNDGMTVDLTGRVKAAFSAGYDTKNTTANTLSHSNSSFDSSGRLGFDLSQKLNDQWTALASAQWDVVGQRDDNGSGFQSRDIYVGFDGNQYGTIAIGQKDGAFYTTVLEPTDIMNEWGDAGNAAGGRQQGIVTYDNSFMGFGLHLSAGAHADTATVGPHIAEAEAPSDFSRNNVLAAGIDYMIEMHDAGSIGLNAAYQSKHLEYSPTTGSSYDLHQTDWGIGANYSVMGFYVAAMYNQSKLDSDAAGSSDVKTKGYELVATYTVDQWKFLTGYNKLELKDEISAGIDKDLVSESYLGVQYNFTSNILIYTEYKFAGKYSDAVSTTAFNNFDPDNQWVTAIKYNF
ncbi:porin [Dongshaea marina]|uniref:porin n=1 Tax=Dongshaea marina TaxID=2047966 RepID=UPI000D3E93E6|nr:porin [Dongshaea marina]